MPAGEDNLLEDFLQMMSAEKGASLNTLDSYRRDLIQFWEFQGNKTLESISPDDISAFIRNLSQRYAPKSVARKISAIREYFKFLFSENELRTNPASHLEIPKQPKPLPKFLDEDEISRLVQTAKKHPSVNFMRITAMLQLMYCCGLRVSELVTLPENCINFDKKQILIFGKGSKERIIPVSDSALEAIAKYKKTYRDKFITPGRRSQWLFPSYSASGHLTRDAFYKDLKNLAVEAGIPPSRVSPHVLRHSFATKLLNHGANLRSVQQMLGHSSIATTEIYTHITPPQLIDIVNKNHPLNRLKRQ